MKIKYFKTILFTATLGIMASLTACEDYLDIVPKGQKSPQTFDDYEALLADDRFHVTTFADMNEFFMLVNEREWASADNTSALNKANWNWDETADRIPLANSSNLKYYYNFLYKGITVFNLVIEDVDKASGATDQQKRHLKAQAKVLRAMNYFSLVSKYAAAYSDTAARTPAVAINNSTSLEEKHPQASLQEVYDVMEQDLREAIELGLPKEPKFGYEPKAGAAHAMLARVCLFRHKFDEAFKYADLALKEHGDLDDLVKFYQDEKANIDASYTYNPGTVLNSREHYVFRQTTSLNTTHSLTAARSARFDAGDTRLLTKFKYRMNYSTGKIGYQLFNGDKNPAPGLRTPEMYYIKAECLARENKLQEALDQVNLVRIKRILPENYQPLTASGKSKKDVIDIIREERCNEYVFQGMEYLDMRRFNTEAEHKRTLTGLTSTGQPKQLTPESHLWVQPFPYESLLLTDYKQNTK